jgi:hypothetical protein
MLVCATRVRFLHDLSLEDDHAQALIEGKTWDGLPKVDVTNGFTVADRKFRHTASSVVINVTLCSVYSVQTDVLKLFKLSQKMRSRRFENGALAIKSPKLSFSLDHDGNPVNCGVYEINDSKNLIEEVNTSQSSHIPRAIYGRKHTKIANSVHASRQHGRCPKDLCLFSGSCAVALPPTPCHARNGRIRGGGKAAWDFDLLGKFEHVAEII